MVTYEIPSVLRIRRIKLLSHGTLIIAKAIGKGNKLMIFKMPLEVNNNNVLEPTIKYDLVSMPHCYLLNCGNILLISWRSEYETWLEKYSVKDKSIFQLCKRKLSIGPVSEKRIRCELTKVCKNYLVAVHKSVNIQEFFLKMYDCSRNFKEVFSLVLNNNELEDIRDVCILGSCSTLALIATNMKFVEIDICTTNIKIQNILEMVPDHINLRILYKILLEIHYDMISEDTAFLLSKDEGWCLDLKTKYCFYLQEHCPYNADFFFIENCQVCQFNKWIYFSCRINDINNVFFVYDPYNQVMTNVVRIDTDHVKSQFTMSSFGDKVYIALLDKIYVENIFRNKCLSLKYLSCVALFKRFPYDQLKQMKFGKQMERLIFDNRL